MKTVLVVDNSDLIRSMLRDILESDGLKIVGEAVTVEEGINAFKTLRPDIVFLDLVMPGGSGIDVLKSIMSANPKARVIVVTSISQTQVDRQLLDIGACVIVHKPFGPDAIKAAVDKAIASLSITE